MSVTTTNTFDRSEGLLYRLHRPNIPLLIYRKTECNYTNLFLFNAKFTKNFNLYTQGMYIGHIP